MKFITLILTLFISSLAFAQLPEGFVYAKDLIPDLTIVVSIPKATNP